MTRHAAANAEMGVSPSWPTPDEFKAHVREWADRIGVKPGRIQVQHISRKWASCSPIGTLTFSSDLLNEDHVFAEAVIVHELIHLMVRNHGRLFRSLLQAYAPHGFEVLNGRFACT